MITKDSCIFIAGDSWGCGEWGPMNGIAFHGNVHRGLEQFLIEYGCKNIKNVSWGGSSNQNAYNNVVSELRLNPDIIFWFQTDPVRDLRPYDNYSINSRQQLFNDHARLLDEAYKSFNSLEIPVYIIGGCSKVYEELVKKYTNLTSLIPSIIEFLTTSMHPPFWCTDWSHTISDSIDKESLNLLYKELNNPPILLKKLHPEFFWPDGCHVNRHGHKKIFEYIVEKFNL